MVCSMNADVGGVDLGRAPGCALIAAEVPRPDPSYGMPQLTQPRLWAQHACIKNENLHTKVKLPRRVNMVAVSNAWAYTNVEQISQAGATFANATVPVAFDNGGKLRNALEDVLNKPSPALLKQLEKPKSFDPKKDWDQDSMEAALKTGTPDKIYSQEDLRLLGKLVQLDHDDQVKYLNENCPLDPRDQKVSGALSSAFSGLLGLTLQELKERATRAKDDKASADRIQEQADQVAQQQSEQAASAKNSSVKS